MWVVLNHITNNIFMIIINVWTSERYALLEYGKVMITGLF